MRGYLLHYGYAQSLAAFDAAAGMTGEDACVSPGGDASGSVGPGQQAAAGPSEGSSQQQQQGSPAAAAGGQQGVGGAAATCSAATTLPLRAQLRQLLMTGDTAAALALLQQQAPELLLPGDSAVGSNGDSGSFELRFHMACQQYIELIRCVCGGEWSGGGGVWLDVGQQRYNQPGQVCE